MQGICGNGVMRGAAVACLVGMCAAATSLAARVQSTVARTRASTSTVQALFVSDIHFEPFWDPAKVERLNAARVGEWKAILAEPDAADRGARFAELQETCHARGEDTAYALLASSLAAMRARAGGAKFAVVSGDLMAHSFSCKYATLFPLATPADYRAFAEKTLDFVLASMREAMPGVPVYAALGNNDSDCGDYQLDANSAFLAGEADEFTRGLAAGDREEARRTFAMGGYYSAGLPAPMKRAKLLVLDDLFMSRRYETCGGKDDHAPAAAEIGWLAQQLDSARKRGEKVWVMAHIPPGVDAYSTATKGKDICAGNKPTMFLGSEALAETMARFGDVIGLAIFAHTHMDEVRWLAPAGGDAKSAGVAIKMVPSISPIDGNDPAFTVATIDAATATLKDYRVIAAGNMTGADTTWAEEYDFAKTYGERDFSAASARDLIGQLLAAQGAKGEASQSYIRNYDVGQPARDLGVVWPMYACVLKNDAASAFRSCVCGGK